MSQSWKAFWAGSLKSLKFINLEVQKAGSTKIRKSKKQEVQKAGSPKGWKSKSQKSKKLEVSLSWKSKKPEAWKAESPFEQEVQKARSPKSWRVKSWKSKRLNVPKLEVHHCVPPWTCLFFYNPLTAEPQVHLGLYFFSLQLSSLQGIGFVL